MWIWERKLSQKLSLNIYLNIISLFHECGLWYSRNMSAYVCFGMYACVGGGSKR